MALQKFIPLREYNPYHDASGRFTGSGGAKTTVAYAGKRPAGMGKGKAAIRREMGADAEMKRLFPNGPTSRSFQKDSRGKGGEHHAAAADHFGMARLLLQRGATKFDVDFQRKKGMAERKAARRDPGGRQPEHRERVPQDPKRHTRRPNLTGQRPPGGKTAILRKGKSPVSPLMAQHEAGPQNVHSQNANMLGMARLSGNRSNMRTAAAERRRRP